MPDDVYARSWWGAHPLPEGSAARWRIGPLEAFAHRLPHEWRLAFIQGDDPLDDRLEESLSLPASEVPDIEDAMRFGFKRSPPSLYLEPALADRNVVVRPERTLLIPKGEGVTVYVSTPLWLKLSFDRDEAPLHEVATYRPSDTWFGPSTIVGELCYASRSRGYLSLDEVKRYPHRARTAVHIVNRAPDPLRVDRLNVPVRHLSLFAAKEAGLWTDRVTLTREADGELAAMRISEGPPPELTGTLKLGEPRSRAETNVVVRAFEQFFKEKER